MHSIKNGGVLWLIVYFNSSKVCPRFWLLNAGGVCFPVNWPIMHLILVAQCRWCLLSCKLSNWPIMHSNNCQTSTTLNLVANIYIIWKLKTYFSLACSWKKKWTSAVVETQSMTLFHDKSMLKQSNREPKVSWWKIILKVSFNLPHLFLPLTTYKTRQLWQYTSPLPLANSRRPFRTEKNTVLGLQSLRFAYLPFQMLTL